MRIEISEEDFDRVLMAIAPTSRMAPLRARLIEARIGSLVERVIDRLALVERALLAGCLTDREAASRRREVGLCSPREFCGEVSIYEPEARRRAEAMSR